MDLVGKKIIDYNQKMNPIKFYLAHATESKPKVRKWEQKFERRTGIQLINPFFDCNTEETQFGKEGKEKYPRMKEKVIQLYEGDLKQIARKDVIGGVVIADDSWTWGVPAEQSLLWASSKLVYTIILKKNRDYQNHPVLRKYSNMIFTSFADFEEWIKNNQRNLFRNLEKTRRERIEDSYIKSLVDGIIKDRLYLGK